MESLSKLLALPEDVLKRMLAVGKSKQYSVGQTVAEPGSFPQTIGIVESGILKMQRHLLDGQNPVVGLLVRGDIFGRVFDSPLKLSIEAATNAKVYLFQKAQFEALLPQSPELEKLIMLSLMNEIDRAQDWMMVLAHHKVRGRLAGFFLLLCTRFGATGQHVIVHEDAIHIRIPLSRTDIANLLGARPESISRALHAMADDGLIEIISPERVAIKDLKGLSLEAGEFDLGEADSLDGLVSAIRSSLDAERAGRDRPSDRTHAHVPLNLRPDA